MIDKQSNSNSNSNNKNKNKNSKNNSNSNDKNNNSNSSSSNNNISNNNCVANTGANKCGIEETSAVKKMTKGEEKDTRQHTHTRAFAAAMKRQAPAKTTTSTIKVMSKDDIRNCRLPHKYNQKANMKNSPRWVTLYAESAESHYSDHGTGWSRPSEAEEERLRAKAKVLGYFFWTVQP